MSALAPLWPLGHSPKGLAVSSATSLPVPKVHQAFGKQITEQNGPRLDSPCPWTKVSRAGRLLGPLSGTLGSMSALAPLSLAQP